MRGAIKLMLPSPDALPPDLMVVGGKLCRRRHFATTSSGPGGAIRQSQTDDDLGVRLALPVEDERTALCRGYGLNQSGGHPLH